MAKKFTELRKDLYNEVVPHEIHYRCMYCGKDMDIVDNDRLGFCSMECMEFYWNEFKDWMEGE